MKPLKLVSATRTPERQTLADAIAASAEAATSADAVRSTVERARGALVAAQMKHSTAESLLAEARERAIGAITARDGAQPAGLAELRRAEADAADDVEIAREALARAEAAIGDTEYRESKARKASRGGSRCGDCRQCRACLDSGGNRPARDDAARGRVSRNCRVPATLVEPGRQRSPAARVWHHLLYRQCPCGRPRRGRGALEDSPCRASDRPRCGVG